VNYTVTNKNFKESEVELLIAFPNPSKISQGAVRKNVIRIYRNMTLSKFVSRIN